MKYKNEREAERKRKKADNEGVPLVMEKKVTTIYPNVKGVGPETMEEVNDIVAKNQKPEKEDHEAWAKKKRRRNLSLAMMNQSNLRWR